MNKNMLLIAVLSLAFGVSAEVQNASTVSSESSPRKAQQQAQRILSEPQEAKPVSASTDSSWKQTRQKKDNIAEQDKKSDVRLDKTAPDSDKKKLNH